MMLYKNERKVLSKYEHDVMLVLLISNLFQQFLERPFVFLRKLDNSKYCFYHLRRGPEERYKMPNVRWL